MGGRRCLRGGQFKGWEGASLVVQWLRLCPARATGSPLVVELRSHMPGSAAKRFLKRGWGGEEEDQNISCQMLLSHVSRPTLPLPSSGAVGVQIEI